MKKTLTALTAAASLSLLSGCLYTNITVPLDTDLNQTQLGSARGESEFESYLGLIAIGDAGTQAAAANGNIKTLRHADTEIFSILFGLYYRQKTIVYGD